MSPTTWEVIVFDGKEWFRTPGCQWDTREQAEGAAARLFGLAPVYVRSTTELETVGLPEGAPRDWRTPTIGTPRIRR